MAEIVNITGASFLTSAVARSQYPVEKRPEIAFVGRSNVGKSTLTNSLMNRRNLAHTSKTPGKTQMINFFLVGANVASKGRRYDFYLVDLPGYGYARAAKSERLNWANFIEEYLQTSPQLKFVCQLIDSRHEPMASDINMFNWLVSRGIPVLVIATKMDKLGKQAQLESVSCIKRTLGVPDLDVLPYSSVKGMGRAELLSAIAEAIVKPS